MTQNSKVKQPFVILKQAEPKEISSKHSGVKRLEQQQKRSSDQTAKRKRCSYCFFKSKISKLNQDNQLLSHQINHLQERLNYLVTVVEEVTAQQVEQVNIFFKCSSKIGFQYQSKFYTNYRRKQISKLPNRWRWRLTKKA